MNNNTNKSLIDSQTKAARKNSFRNRKTIKTQKIRDTQTFNIFHLKLRYKTEQHNQLHNLIQFQLCKKIDILFYNCIAFMQYGIE